jgi:hypothetical protein
MTNAVLPYWPRGLWGTYHSAYFVRLAQNRHYDKSMFFLVGHSGLTWLHSLAPASKEYGNLSFGSISRLYLSRQPRQLELDLASPRRPVKAASFPPGAPPTLNPAKHMPKTDVCHGRTDNVFLGPFPRGRARY